MPKIHNCTSEIGTNIPCILFFCLPGKPWFRSDESFSQYRSLFQNSRDKDGKKGWLSDRYFKLYKLSFDKFALLVRLFVGIKSSYGRTGIF